jgi:phospholipase/carboxylesterase
MSDSSAIKEQAIRLRARRWLLLGLIAGALALFAWLRWSPAPATATSPVGAAVPASAPTAATAHDYPRSGLRTFEIGGAPAVILMHGYGSDPQAWFPFVETIVVPGRGRLIFPMGPEPTTPPDAPEGERAWWKLELHTYRTPTGIDMASAHPPGLLRAAARVSTLIDEVDTRLGGARGTTVLGGFSQGAMVAAETAFTTNTPLRALVLLGGTLVNESAWRAGMASRKNLPIFLAHGRSDSVLPFAAAERLRAALTHSGLHVTWVPFDGAHEITPVVVARLNQFLATLPD